MPRSKTVHVFGHHGAPATDRAFGPAGHMRCERNVWQNFVASELLYSTDRSLLSRFIDPAPFSKFYLEFDSETPGRLGRFMGYKMIVSYMKNNDTPLKTMLIQPADVIFASAKYKP